MFEQPHQQMAKEPILKINAVIIDDESKLGYRVDIIQGVDQINSEEELIDAIPSKSIIKVKGIIEVKRYGRDNWLVIVNK